MNVIPVIVIFDVGKTNKKVFVFDEDYQLVFERSARFTETYDEEGDVGENLESLRLSVFSTLNELINRKDFLIKAVNFSGYGASLVYIDEKGIPVAPLYNYLKAYPETIKKRFYQQYGEEKKIAVETSSPVLGSLNSGMQLYRIKYEKPDLFKQIHYAVHLPQYLSYLVTGKACSGLTSIGCHTQLWDFSAHRYHHWVTEEGIDHKMAPLFPEDQVFLAEFSGQQFKAGIGLHDSSAALIPYLINFKEPFILISTGTWCITMNPFDESPLTAEALDQDCLNYMQYKGKPVSASRIFAGYEHEQQVKRIAAHFSLPGFFYQDIQFDAKLAETSLKQFEQKVLPVSAGKTSGFENVDLSVFKTAEEAYYRFILYIVKQQSLSAALVMKNVRPKRIFVDGGFSKNHIYMNFLAWFFPDMEVFAASMAQASAIGAALAIHEHWNKKSIPNHIIDLKYYSGKHTHQING